METARAATIEVRDEPCQVRALQLTQTTWRASGWYKGTFLEVTGAKTARQAFDRWKRKAEAAAGVP
jgi:hypothetical protein